MLKNIRLHLAKDESEQEKLEEKLATHISKNQKANINAFQRYIPSLLPYAKNVTSQNVSIFCNKYGHLNIVDYGLGRTIYGFDPDTECQKHVDEFLQHSPYVNFADHLNAEDSEEAGNSDDENSLDFRNLPVYLKRKSFSPLPESVECLVIFGCGLGAHIKTLIETVSIQHLIIYEPEAQFFQCSILSTAWNDILTLANAKGTRIYVQVEKDGRDLISDLDELRKSSSIKGFYFYQHYNHPIFSSICKQLINQSWPKIESQGISFKLEEHYTEYCPAWTSPISLERYSNIHTKDDLFKKNLATFKHYFPDIHDRFKDYTPKTWLPAVTQNDSVNLLKKDNLVNWYSDDPKNDCILNYENFNEQPNKDGLVLGYTGKKLAHYLHYKFVKATEKLLNEVEEEEGALPENIQSIILFGIGAGYQLEHLCSRHTLENIFICEPNSDFFYSSLFAIDWQQILEKIDTSKARIYMNIGDDGSHLVRDLLNQFYSIGPYILSNTFFYQSYYNASLNGAIASLREQLQFVISMGEYFDHAYYGIAQTVETINRGYKFLKAEPSKKLSFFDKSVPIFLVGNGPSLDHSIATLKEWRDKAIIISCGTSLQVLQRNGMIPDFHAEIEQNRTTFDWAALIDDLDYLKQISLISCNGIHPDTCDLYKDVFVAFKEGESSTVSTLEVMGKEDYESLSFAFPTVANFACNLFSQMGFQSIYLIGVDLGFVDSKKHHSVESGYYTKEGEELYDYSDSNNTSLIVPGNFRKTVNTKHEFKIAKQIIEQSIVRTDKSVGFYNCSDGAFIHGTNPLPLDNILVTTEQGQKLETLDKIKNKVFDNDYKDSFAEDYSHKYETNTLIKELTTFKKLLERDLTTLSDAENLVKLQKELLFHSYQHGKSLLFYYLYGTTNFANAMLSKLLYCKAEQDEVPKAFLEGVALWSQSFSQICEVIKSQYKTYDASVFRPLNREEILNKNSMAEKSILVVTDSVSFRESIIWSLQNPLKWDVKLRVIDHSSLHSEEKTSHDYVIYHHLPPVLARETLPIKGKYSTIAVIYGEQTREIRAMSEANPNIVFMPILNNNTPLSDSSWAQDNLSVAFLALRVVAQNHTCQVVLPKYAVQEGYDEGRFEDSNLFNVADTDKVFNYKCYLTIDFQGSKPTDDRLPNGSRGKLLYGEFNFRSQILWVNTEEEFSDVISKIMEYIPTLENDQPHQGKYEFRNIKSD